MPFDFKKYDEKCAGLTAEQLQLEWNRYTRLITSASTSTAVSGAAVPATFGVSAVGVALAAPALHNARKKRTIIERHLQTHNTTHVTRARDVLPGVALSSASGVMGLHASHAAAEALVAHGGGSAATAAELAIHAGLEGASMGGEQVRENRRKAKEEEEPTKRQMKDRRKELKAERKEERRAEKKTKKALKKKAKQQEEEEEEEEAGKSESECDSEDQRHVVEAEAELPSARDREREPAELLHAPMPAPPPPDHAHQVPVYYYYHEAADGAQRSYQMPAPAPGPMTTACPRAEAPWRLDRPYVAGTTMTTTTYHELA